MFAVNIISRLNTLIKPTPRINKNGKGIISFIDVGSIGQLPSPWLDNANIIKHVLKFEPQDKFVNEDNITGLDYALWKEKTIREFYIFKGFNSTGSSLFKQNIEYVKENYDDLIKRGPRKLALSWFERSELIKTLNIECEMLDNILTRFEEPFDFLKIDAQGAEYEILKGSSKFLQNDCLGLHLELFNIPLYKGIKLLPEVEKFVKKFGFSLALKMASHGTFDSQHDCIFLKENVEPKNQNKLNTIKETYKIKHN